MENQGFCGGGREPYSQFLIVLERNRAALLSPPSNQHKRNPPTSTCLIGKPRKGYKVSRP